MTQRFESFLVPMVVLLIAAFVFLSPELAFAQQGIVAQCTGINCQLCNLFGLFNNVIQYSIFVASVIAAIMFAWAGALFVFAMGDPGKIASAKHIFATVLTGYIIALVAVIGLDTLINVIANNGFKWRSVQCVSGRITSGGLTFQDTPIIIVSKTNGWVSPEGNELFNSATGQRFTDVGQAAIALIDNLVSKDGRSPPATENGNKACAWAVNQILTAAGYDTIDDLSVPDMYRILKTEGRGQLVPIEQAQPGDIAIRGDIGHVGICTSAGCGTVASNSSSQGVLKNQSEVGFQVNQYGVRTPTVVYRPTKTR